MPQNHAFGGQLCRRSKTNRSPHEIAVQNVHISMEYPCSVRFDVYCQKLGGSFWVVFCSKMVVLAPAGGSAGRSDIEFSVSAPPGRSEGPGPGPQKTKNCYFDRYMTVTRPLLPLHCAAGETRGPGISYISKRSKELFSLISDFLHFYNESYGVAHLMHQYLQ